MWSPLASEESHLMSVSDGEESDWLNINPCDRLGFAHFSSGRIHDIVILEDRVACLSAGRRRCVCDYI